MTLLTPEAIKKHQKEIHDEMIKLADSNSKLKDLEKNEQYIVKEKII